MNGSKGALQVALFILSVSCCNLQALNSTVPTEVSECTKVKKSVFEKKTTFSFFIHGAEPIVVTTDQCKAFAPFIVSGVPANPKEFPLMARLGHMNTSSQGQQPQMRWFCGGTLISGKYVLTAAHCFYSRHGEVNRVRLGELDFSTDDDDAQPEDFTVRRYTPHNDYDWRESSIYNDIGLIELEEPVTFNRYIHPACLPSSLNGDAEFDSYIAIGWGSTHFAADDSDYLLKVKLDRFSYDQCAQHTNTMDNDKLIRGLDKRSQMCAGSNVTKDTCNGDSGGPLLAYHPEFPCMYTIVGITSTGISGCGTPNVPGIYTRVFNYLDWIKTTVWK